MREHITRGFIAFILFIMISSKIFFDTMMTKIKYATDGNDYTLVGTILNALIFTVLYAVIIHYL